MLTNGYSPCIVDPVRVASFAPVVCVADAVEGNLKLLPSELELVGRLPVQLAPVGQQAMWSFASREHRDPCLQHTSGLSMLVHGLCPAGQLLSERFKIRNTSSARAWFPVGWGGENGSVFVSMESPVEMKNVVEIHPAILILTA